MTTTHTTQILRIREACRRTALSRSQLYRLISARDFPEPIPLGPRARGWVESDVEDWLRQRIASTRRVA